MPNIAKWGAAVLGLVLILVVGVLITGWFWIRNWLGGEEFRAMASSKVSAVLGVEGQFEPFHWSGFSVHTGGFVGEGSGGALARVEAKDIRARLNIRGLFRGVWEVSSVDIARAAVTIHPPSEGSAPDTASGVAVVPGPEGPFSAWLPRKVEILRVSGLDTRVAWSMPSGGEGRAEGVRLEGRPEGVAWMITGNGGTIRQPGWPDFGVQPFRIRFVDRTLYILESSFSLREGGTVAASGEASLEGDYPLNLDVSPKKAAVAPFLPPDWRARVEGGLTGTVRIKGPARTPENLRVEGRVRLEDGRLVGLPGLDRMEPYLPTERYRSIPLEQAHTDFVWSTKSLRLTGLRLESRALIRLEGALAVEEGRLDGGLDLGVTDESLVKLPGSREFVFVRVAEGYRWAPVKISGTTSDPTEDLSPRLKEAYVRAAAGGIKDLIQRLPVGDETRQGLGDSLDRGMDAVLRGLFR
jgi:hypothetical protein